MKMHTHTMRSLASLAFTVTTVFAQTGEAPPAGPARITVQADRPGARISPLLYGIFFEEINRAGDGGLYAEMIMNRSFEDAGFPLGWSLVKGDGAEVAMALETDQPLNGRNPHSLKLLIGKTGGKRAGIANAGFAGGPYARNTEPNQWPPTPGPGKEVNQNGMAVQAGHDYLLSFCARGGEGFAGPLTASLETQNGSELAAQTVSGVTAEWKKFSCVLRAKATANQVRLVLAANSPGTAWFDMVSLVPKDTYKGHGMRVDLMQKLADMKPAFVRFPGGCWVEGDEMAYAYRWKETIGDNAERRSLWNRWGYCSTHGLGFHEYLQVCEDLGAEPLFVINVGMAHKNAVPMEKMDEFVQDALDAIEYCNGPADSKWGALRAQAGHPAPFNLKYMEIGNENSGPKYVERYALFHDAIKKRHPELRLIVDYRPTGTRPADIVDEHYYNTPEFFMGNAEKYDKYDRAAHKVYVGEYAVTRGAGRGNLAAALGEAAFMTGMERNGDVVVMASYAPLFENIGWRRWNPNAILFDAAKCYGTPSYQVQALFGNHRADVVLPVELESPTIAIDPIGGLFGVGSWNTKAEFKDLKVTQGQEVLFESDFTRAGKSMRLTGDCQVQDGVLAFGGTGTDGRALAGKPEWKNYTITLKARKTGGAEGFLVIFRVRNEKEKSWWNIGGWGNQQHGLEMPGLKNVARVPGKIETGKWYDIKVELAGPSIRCYLDGKLIHDVSMSERLKALYATAGRTADGQEVILKVVNVSDKNLETALDLKGLASVKPGARNIVLTSGSVSDENSLDEPTKIAAREVPVKIESPAFHHTFPAHSVTVLRIEGK